MYKTNKRLYGATFAIAVLINSSAFATGANGSIGGVSVPTLSGSMLIILSLLLFAIAFRLTRQNTRVNKLFVSILGVGMLVSAGSGIKLVSSVDAAPTNILLSTGDFGPGLDIPGNPNSGYYRGYTNDTGHPVVVSFTAHAGSACYMDQYNPPAKPANKPTKLALAPAPCGNLASSGPFDSAAPVQVIIPAGQSCILSCDGVALGRPSE